MYWMQIGLQYSPVFLAGNHASWVPLHWIRPQVQPVMEVDLAVLGCMGGTGCLGVAHNIHSVAAVAGIDMRGNTCFLDPEGRYLESSQNFLVAMRCLPHKMMGIAPLFLLHDLSTTLHCYYR